MSYGPEDGVYVNYWTELPIVNNLGEYLLSNTPSRRFEEYSKKLASKNAEGNTLTKDEVVNDMNEMIGFFQNAWKERERVLDVAFMDDLYNEEITAIPYNEDNYLSVEATREDYDIRIMKEIENYCNNIIRQFKDLFTPYFGESEEIKLNSKGSFRAWYLKYSYEPEFIKIRKLKEHLLSNTYLSQEVNSSITDRVELTFNNHTGEINTHNLDDFKFTEEELRKIFAYNLNARFIKWSEKSTNPFIKEDAFLRNEIEQFKSRIASLSPESSKYSYANNFSREYSSAIARENLKIAESRLKKYLDQSEMPVADEKEYSYTILDFKKEMDNPLKSKFLEVSLNDKFQLWSEIESNKHKSEEEFLKEEIRIQDANIAAYKKLEKEYNGEIPIFLNLFHTLSSEKLLTAQNSLTNYEKRQQEGLERYRNDVLKYLEEFKDEFKSVSDFNVAVDAIASYFHSGNISLKTPVFVKNGNIKKIAFAMGEIWREISNDIINHNYLKLYKQLFSIFGDQNLDENNVFGNNLYKYSVSKT